MKSFWCGQVVPGCRRQFRAESDDEILRQVAQQASEDHDMHEMPADGVDATDLVVMLDAHHRPVATMDTDDHPVDRAALPPAALR